jgi:hypothetical protein
VVEVLLEGFHTFCVNVVNTLHSGHKALRLAARFGQQMCLGQDSLTVGVLAEIQSADYWGIIVIVNSLKAPF